MSGKNTVSRLLFAALIVTLMAAPAGAYTVLKTYIGASKYWPGSTASWTVGSSGMPGVDNESFQEAIGAAFDSWEEIGCSELTFTSEGFSGFDPGGGDPLHGDHEQLGARPERRGRAGLHDDGQQEERKDRLGGHRLQRRRPGVEHVERRLR